MRSTILICLVALIWSRLGMAQNVTDTVSVSFLKTTSMVFEYPIVNVDRGSRDLIAQKVAEVRNILQLKAGRPNFPETNLTVITADGALHHFYVNYSEHPEIQVYRISGRFVQAHLNAGRTAIEYDIATDRIHSLKRSGTITKDKGFHITFSVKAIYVHEDMIFFRLLLRNKSNIKYDIHSLRFFVRDRKNLRRTASQEVELRPVYIRNEIKSVSGNSSADFVFVFQKFTLPDAKSLDVELFEQIGGRNLKVHIGNHSIVRAELLPINLSNTLKCMFYEPEKFRVSKRRSQVPRIW